jgi:hypothetical protein
MLEYELNGKIYTEEEINKAAGGKDRAAEFIKSKGYKLVDKKKDQFAEINKTKKKPIPTVTPGVNDFGAQISGDVKPFSFKEQGTTPEYKAKQAVKGKALKVEQNKVAEKQSYLDKTSEYRTSEALDKLSFDNPFSVDYDINKTSPVETVVNLNKKLNRLGIEVSENTFGDKLNLKKIKGVGPTQFTQEQLDQVEGADFDLKDVKGMNDFVSKFGDKDYAQKIKASAKTKYPDLWQKITPPLISPKDKKEQATQSLVQQFKDIEESSKSMTSSFSMGTGAQTEINKNSFDNPEDYELYKQWKKDPTNPIELSESRINAWDKKRKETFIDRAATDYARGLSPDARKELQILTQEKVNDTKYAFESLTKDIDTYKASTKQFDQDVNLYKENPSVQGLDILKKKQISLIDQQNEIGQKQNQLQKESEFASNVLSPAITAFGANYNRLSQLANATKSTAIDIAASLRDISAYGSAVIANTTHDELIKEDRFGIFHTASELAKKKEQYQKAVGIDQIDNLDDAGNWIMGSTMNTLPSIGMAFTGGAALPLFFASGYGGKATQMAIEAEDAKKRLSTNYAALNETEDAFEKAGIQQQIEADEHLLSLPEYKKFAAKAIYGTAEVGFEMLSTLKILNGVGNATKMLPKKTITEGLKWAGKTAVKNFNTEGLSELATTITDNFADIYILDQNKNLFEGGLESYTQGGLMGIGFEIPETHKVIKRAIVSELADKRQNKRMQDIVNQISELTGIAGYKMDQSIPLPLQTPAVQKLVAELLDESETMQSDILSRVGTDLSIENVKQIGDINRQIRDINKDFTEAAKDPSLTPVQLKTLESYYRGKFNELVNQRENILTDPNIKEANTKVSKEARFEFDLTQGYNTYNQKMQASSIANIVKSFNNLDSASMQSNLSKAKTELELEKGANTENITDENIKKRALENYAENHYTNAIKEGIVNAQKFANDKGVNIEIQQFEGPDANANIINAFNQSDQANDPKIKEEFAKAIENGSIEGANITINGKDVALVHIKNSAKNGRTGVGAHEVLHSAVKKAFNDQKGVDKAGANLLEYLEKYNPNLHALVTARIDSSYAKRDKKGLRLRDEKGEIIKDETYYEEALTALSDLASDNIDLPKDTINAIRNFVNGLLPSGFPKFKENQGADVYQFIKDYNKEAHFGKQQKQNTINFSGKIKGGDQEKAKLSITKVNEIQQKIDKLEDQFDNDEIEYDDYTSRLESLERDLEKAKLLPEDKPKPEVKKAEVSDEDADEEIIKTERGSVSSDKVQKIYDEKGLNGAQDIIDLFRPITKKLVNRRMDAPGFDRELLTDEIETGVGGILDLINKYKPESGVPLAAFINKYLPVRAIAASRRVLDAEFSKDVTEEKGLMAQETVSEAKEKPKYKNALESNVFESEVLKTMSNKILTQLRTLKSRIDAPISLNRTVTPLISEIRDAMGKQLDIDVKAAMGGKKDGQLVKWLLKNKRYVLENMTTTWLMGANGQGGIPQAIQKRIDGKWVSYPDWVDQKIDRESVSTDNAGRTSGAEMVRRLPNVFNNVSNEDYLGQTVGADGNPIRGRKESLAKAVSEESAFDIINNDFENQGPIFDAFSTNQVRLGYEIANNTIAEFAKQSERGNVKYSKTYNNFSEEQKALFKENINKLSNELNPFLNNINRDLSIRRAFNNVFKNLLIDNKPVFTEDNIDNLVKDFIPWLRQMRDIDKANEKFLEDENFDFNKFLKNIAELNEYFPLEVLGMPGIEQKLFTAANVNNARETSKSMISYWNDTFGSEEAMKMAIYLTLTFSGNTSLGNSIGLDVDKNGIVFETNIKGRRSDQITKNSKDYWDNIVFPSFSNLSNKEKIKLKEKVRLETLETRRRDSASRAYKDKDWGIRKNEAEYHQKIVQRIFEFYFNKNNNISDADKAIMIRQMGSNMQSAMKKSAILTYEFIKNKKDENIGSLRYEHSRPANKVSGDLVRIYMNSNGKPSDEAIKAIWKTYEAAIIPVTMDDNFNAILLEATMVPGWKVGDPVYYRYYNYATFGKPNMYSIANVFTGEIIGEKFVEASNALREGIKNIEKVEAITKSYKQSKTAKGISVFDFDDTVGLTKSNVLYTMPDGSTGKLNAEEFAKNGKSMLDEGAIFDFSEFSKVVDGKPGPMIEKMKKMIGKFGSDHFYILTARPADSAVPIHEFLSSIGIDIPLENITGLGNSTAQAKADWMVGKANEGYNDFYFADDHLPNVTAVKDALDVLDVKSKIQQAKIKFSKTMSGEFNKIIEENTGMEHYKMFSDIVARRRGAKKNKFDFYVPPSAADFELLLYKFMGSGERGDEQKEFFTKALLEPYMNGVDLMDTARQSIKKGYKGLLKSFPGIKDELEKLIPSKDFTYDQAMRVAIWSEFGVEIPGLSERDKIKLTDLINSDPDLNAFKAGLVAMGRQKNGWVDPSAFWDTDTIVSDLYNITEGAGRKEFLQEFIDNVENIFGKWEAGRLVGPNMNKVEAVYGTNVREAIEDSLYRMINGKNRSFGQDKETAMWSSWVNGSTASIMFLNTRSVALQLLGAVNFLNFRDNNPYNAAKAFANQPQYWKDFAHIWNSDKMKERRGGLKEDVAAAEIANSAANSKNKVRSVMAYLLKIGYTPTQLADSFAIASGGAPFYRNRINTYLKQGLTEQEAEKAAWKDFTKVSDETQQSGDPKDISKQQASGAGRLLLVFQNFTMQQARIVKKSVLDLKNGRGDAKTHIAKIAYYLAIQNIMFSTLQQGLFAVLFDDDDDDDKKKKEKTNKMLGVANGVLDSIIRGTGLAGGVISTIKNIGMKYFEEKDKGFKADYAKVALEAANMSPPIGSKLKKIYSAAQQTKFEKDLIDARGWSIMQDGRVHLGPMYSVTGKLVEAGVNIPMDRFVSKVENISQALNSENTTVQRIATGMGFSPWSVGVEETKGDKLIMETAKATRKEEGKIKAETTRKENAEREKDSIKNLPRDEQRKLKLEERNKKREAKLKKREMERKLNRNR